MLQWLFTDRVCNCVVVVTYIFIFQQHRWAVPAPGKISEYIISWKMLTHRLLFFKNSKVSPSLQKYTVTWLDLKSCTHPKHEERLIPRSFFLIYKPNPPVNRAFNQKKTHLVSSMLWWKQDPLDCANTWNGHHMKNQPKDSKKTTKDEQYT